MPIRFQADADFNQIIVSAVARRYPEIDRRRTGIWSSPRRLKVAKRRAHSSAIAGFGIRDSRSAIRDQ